MRRVLFASLIAAAMISDLFAQTDAKDWFDRFQINPILQSQDGSTPNFGISYDLALRQLLYERPENPAFAGLDQDKIQHDWAFTLNGEARGTASVNKHTAVNSLMGYSVSASYWRYDLAEDLRHSVSYDIAGFLGYEASQGFEGRSMTYGATGSLLLADYLGCDFIFLSGSAHLVNPDRDSTRIRLIGSQSASDDYLRLSASLYVNIPISLTFKALGTDLGLHKMEINARLWYEPGAPDEVRSAEADRFYHYSIAIFATHDLWVGYGRGILPYELNTDGAYLLGWRFTP